MNRKGAGGGGRYQSVKRFSGNYLKVIPCGYDVREVALSPSTKLEHWSIHAWLGKIDPRAFRDRWRLQLAKQIRSNFIKYLWRLRSTLYSFWNFSLSKKVNPWNIHGGWVLGETSKVLLSGISSYLRSHSQMNRTSFVTLPLDSHFPFRPALCF